MEELSNFTENGEGGNDSEKPETEITHEDLKKLDSWLSDNWSSYRSMIEGGSVAVGDPLIEGRSDWEIAIVADAISEEEKAGLNNFLSTLPKDDRVELVFRITDKLLTNNNDMHQLTGKYRSKTLFGENLIDQIPLPDREVIESFWPKGLNTSLNRIDKYSICAPIWSDEKIRKGFRTVFKDTFLNLQIKAWCETGEFPITRKDLAGHYSSEELEEMWKTLHEINEADRDTILNTAKRISSYISSQHSPST